MATPVVSNYGTRSKRRAPPAAAGASSRRKKTTPSTTNSQSTVSGVPESPQIPAQGHFSWMPPTWPVGQVPPQQPSLQPYMMMPPPGFLPLPGHMSAQPGMYPAMVPQESGPPVAATMPSNVPTGQPSSPAPTYQQAPVMPVTSSQLSSQLSSSDNNATITTQTGQLTPIGTINLIEKSETPLTDICDELGSGVPQKLKEKIWSGQFVHLYYMLLTGDESLVKSVDMVLKEEGIMYQTKPAKEIKTIEVWTTAFMTYMSIFLERHPTRAREMLKYMAVIRQAARDFQGNWRRYDKEFRLRQAKRPSRSWASIDTDLWLLTMSGANYSRHASAEGISPGLSNQSEGVGNLTAQASSQSMKKKSLVCYFYQKNKCNRSSCKYEHKCETCGSVQHGSITCSFRKPGHKSNDSRTHSYKN